MMFKSAMIAILLYFVTALLNVVIYDYAQEIKEPKRYLVFTLCVETIMALGIVQLWVWGK